MSRLAEWIRRAPAEPACFALVFSVYLTYLLTFGDSRFYWDSLAYWRLGDRFDESGSFSLLSYDDPLRGYSLPLAYYGLRNLGHLVGAGDVTIVEIAGALLAAALGVMVLPRLARALFTNAALGWTHVLALNGLIFIYWRGHFNFPLTDFPALLLASLGVLAFLRMSPTGYLAAGLCFGAAANFRTAYMPALVLAMVVAAVSPFRGRSWLDRITAPLLVAFAAFVILVPQMLINHRHRGDWSPAVHGAHEQGVTGFNVSLFAQRSETFVGPRSEYPRAKVYYRDPAAEHAVEAAGISHVTGYGEYARLVADHPLAMAASYALHVFDGLDVWYPTPYVRDLGARHTVLSVLQYTLVFVALVRLVARRAREKLGSIRWRGVLLFASPIFLAVPGTMEPRYFLPLYVLAYMLVCFGPDPRGSFVPNQRARRIVLLSTYTAFLIVFLALSAATRDQIEYRGYSASRSTSPHSSTRSSDVAARSSSEDRPSG